MLAMATPRRAALDSDTDGSPAHTIAIKHCTVNFRDSGKVKGKRKT